MKLSRIAAGIALMGAFVLCLPKLPALAANAPADVNLLSWGAGALVVVAPPSYADSGNWSPESLLDELPQTGWATKAGDLSPKVFVFELAVQSQITSLGFDTAQVENRGRGAKNVKVEYRTARTEASSK